MRELGPPRLFITTRLMFIQGLVTAALAGSLAYVALLGSVSINLLLKQLRAFFDNNTRALLKVTRDRKQTTA